MALLDWIHNRAVLEFCSPERRLKGLEWTSKPHMVLHSGTQFCSAKLFPSEKALAKSMLKRSKPAQAHTPFSICQQIVLGDTTQLINYVEGYTRKGSIVTHTAWLTLQNKVIDPANTHGKCLLPLYGEYPDHYEYIGIVIPSQLAQKLITRNKVFVPLLDTFDKAEGAFGTTPNFGL